MLGKLRIHEAIVEDVCRSEYGGKFYSIRIKYERRSRNYSILLHEGTKKAKAFKKFLNIEKLEDLKGKTILYIAANDLNVAGKVEIWMISNKDKNSFYEIETGKVLNREQVARKVKKFVLSEF